MIPHRLTFLKHAVQKNKVHIKNLYERKYTSPSTAVMWKMCSTPCSRSCSTFGPRRKSSHNIKTTV